MLERPALRAAVDLSLLNASDRLLDLGVGTGAVEEELVTARRIARLTVGIDLSREMLAQASRRCRCYLMQADATALPLPEACIDVTIAAYLLHLLDHPARARALKEVGRVLRPGGRLVVVTPYYGGGRLASILSRFGEGFSGVISGLRPLDPRRALASAGFEVTDVRHVRSGYPSLCVSAVRSGADLLPKVNRSAARA
jgi:SAM-dependent methyltransferase